MDKFFWADKVAEDLIEQKRNKKEFVCASGITPSGTVHIGNFREIITTDLVVRALKKKGKKVRFIYSWDDYDRFRKVPENIPNEKKKEYEGYVGMPLNKVPSPFGKEKNYARHFEEEFERISEKVGIKPEFIYQSQMYKKCKYAHLIKKAIDKRKEIMEILDKYRKEPLEKDWMPIEVYCEKCNKDNTKILNVNGYVIEYSCGCGNKSKFDFRKKGFVKLKWRIDWPARWFYEKVDFEPGGNDHSVEGGSYTTGKEISSKIYEYDAPIYVMYGFVYKKGVQGKMSSSAGNLFTIQEVEEVYEPEILRYLFVGTRPNKEFDISFDNDVIKIYEDYDELERKYYSGETNEQEKKIYEFSRLKVSKSKPKRISFRHISTLVQTGRAKELKGLNKVRVEKVKNWLENYAGEDMKFEIQSEIKIELTEKEREALKILRGKLKKKKYYEEDLINEFYDICRKVGIGNKEFFEVAYGVLINKRKGPRLASLIIATDRNKIIKLLNQIK